MKRKILSMWTVAIVGVIGVSLPVMVSAAEGIAKGETTQQQGQQGIGLSSKDPQESNVIMGGPEIIIGRITKIDGEQYSVEGDRGQDISLRVTKDTNLVCAGSDKAQITAGRESVRESNEIPPTALMQQQSSGGNTFQKATPSQQLSDSPGGGEPTKDPSALKGIIGSTDLKANEDVALGSGFSVGDCRFKVGDVVRVEGSDMGTATTIKQIASESNRSGEDPVHR